jgi:hypothetical protein
MGYNTTVVVMNDALSAIKRDPDFGASLAKACVEVIRGTRIDVESNGHVNAATVLESHHADHLVPVLVGGNTGYAFADIWLPYRDSSAEALLKKLADNLGYTLVKKGKK